MFEDVFRGIKDSAGIMDLRDVMNLNPLVLAYIGDAVYEVFIRTAVIASEPNKPVHKHHLISTNYVKAHAQSDIVHRISEMLTDSELDIIRRGRNSKSGYVPKNADVIEYRTATGFEALIGYLYLSGNMDRLEEILKHSIMNGQDI
jgi:ribonuclease-3 family protein